MTLPPMSHANPTELEHSLRRNPYVIGGWVRGPQFYGRTKLVADMLNESARSQWLSGNRRIGKTSVLRQLEAVGNNERRIAIFVDLQGADSAKTLTEYFLDGDNEERLSLIGLSEADFQDADPPAVLRRLDRAARKEGIQVLLLLDEAEALIEVANNEGDQILKEIQREMQRSEGLAVVLSATRRLMLLDEMCRGWNTSKFLDAVVPCYMGALGPDSARALIRQAQAPSPESVDDAIVDAIINATAGHPFLTQWLCDRLWSEGGLRAPADDDLRLTSHAEPVTRLFQEDFNYLTAGERAMLKALATTETLDAAQLADAHGSADPDKIASLMSPLIQLCFARRSGANFAIGNELLRNWFRYCEVEEPTPQVADDIASDWADEQVQAINQQIELHERRMRLLEEQQAIKGIDTPPEVITEIEDIKAKIEALQRERSRSRGR